MKKFTIILLLCMSYTFYAQTYNFSINDLKSPTGEQIFPFIVNTHNPKLAEKINTFLQLEYLRNIPSSSLQNPFKVAEDDWHGFFESWKICKAPKNILSINISGGGTGNYTSYFSNQENFDSSTGNPILLEELFSKNGLHTIDSIVNQKIRKTLKSFIEESKPESNSAADLERNKEQKEGYKSCYESVNDGDLVAYYKFSFSKDTISFNKEACFPRVIRAIDDLGSFENSFSFNEIRTYLSNYGKYLLLNEKKSDVFPISPRKRMFKGLINKKYPITLVINQIFADGSLDLVYWYSKKKVIIDLNGRFKKNHFSIVENDYHSEALKKWIPRAHIEADWIDDATIIGTWTDYKTKKEYTIELYPY